MADRPKVVTVLGNYSGRNAGDAAILGGLVADVLDAFPDTPIEFRVPTINPGFIQSEFSQAPVRGIGLLPWNLSFKIFGVPLFRSVLQADLVLVTDAILFDWRLYNPLFNYLSSLSLALPLAARRGVPVVLYNMSLGPVTRPDGRKCLVRVLRSCQKIIVRDEPSRDLARTLHPTGPDPLVRADCALNAPEAGDGDVDALVAKLRVFDGHNPVLGFNVNAYVDAYGRDRNEVIDRDWFQATVAAALDRAVQELGVNILLVRTQVMDKEMEDSILRRVAHSERIARVGTPELGFAEIKALMRRLEAFIGMRTHSIILAASVHTPVGAIISYPKTQGFLETIGCGDRSVGFPGFSEESLWQVISGVWDSREALRAKLGRTAEEEKKKARMAADELSPWLRGG